MLQQPAQTAKARIAVRIQTLESIDVMIRTAQVLIQHVQSLESSFAVIDGAHPLTRIRIVVIFILIEYTVSGNRSPNHKPI
jgi:hypothetical protein